MHVQPECEKKSGATAIGGAFHKAALLESYPYVPFTLLSAKNLPHNTSKSLKCRCTQGMYPSCRNGCTPGKRCTFRRLPEKPYTVGEEESAVMNGSNMQEGWLLSNVTGISQRSQHQGKERFWNVHGKRMRKHWQLYLFVLVPVLYFILFKYYPMINSVLAFKDYNVTKGIWGSDWVGMKHFRLFFENPIFWTLVKNTLIISVYQLVVGFPIPILLALSLNEIRNGRFKRFIQLVTFAPYFISTVVIVSMIMLFLAPRLGFVNVALGHLGLEGVNFLGEPGMFRSIHVWSDIWQNAGYSTVIYLAALAGVDPMLYEAAKVDGASRLQKIIHIDLPGILPTATIILILNVGSIMALGFEKNLSAAKSAQS